MIVIIYEPGQKVYRITVDGKRVKEGPLTVYQVCQLLQDYICKKGE